MEEHFVDQNGNQWFLDPDWVGITQDFRIPYDSSNYAPQWFDIDRTNMTAMNEPFPTFHGTGAGMDTGQALAIKGAVEAPTNFQVAATPFVSNELQVCSTTVPLNVDFVPQAVGDKMQGHSAARPVDNDLSSPSVNDEIQSESAAHHLNSDFSSQFVNNQMQANSPALPPSNRAMNYHELSENYSQNEVQADSSTQPSKHVAPDISEPEKHAQYATEYLNHEDSDNESSDDSEVEFDLLNSNFPMIGQLYVWQLPQDSLQSSNIRSGYIIPPALARIKDSTKRSIDTTKSAFDVIEQTVLVSGDASQPIIVDDALESPFNGAAQNPQVLSANRSPASQPIQRHTTISNSRKRVEHPDSSNDEQPVVSNAKRLKIVAPTPRRGKIAKVLRQSPKPALTEYDSPVQQSTAPSVQQSIAPPGQDSGPATAGSQTSSGRLLFANRAQYEQAAASRTVAHNWTPPQNDTSVPKDLERRAFYIKMLVNALKSTEECLDSTNASSFKSRWASLGTAGSTSIITEQQLEAISWKLLEIAEGLHTQGPTSLRIYDEAKLKTACKYRDLTFVQRIDQICCLLRLSKARCEKILKFENLDMVVAAPEQLAKETKVNKKANEVRRKHLKAGRELKKQKEMPPRVDEQEHCENFSQLVEQYKNAELLQQYKDAEPPQQRTNVGRKLKKKMQVYRDIEPEKSEKQVAEALPQAVETPSQNFQVRSQACEEQPQIFDSTQTEIFEPNPFQLFEDAQLQQDFSQTAPQGFNIVPPQDFNVARPQFIDSTLFELFDPELEQVVQQVGEVPQLFPARRQNSEQQFVQLPSDGMAQSNFPEQNNFISSSGGVEYGVPKIPIDPALLEEETQSDFNAPPPVTVWTQSNNSVHGYNQQAQFEEYSSGTLPNPPVYPSIGVQKQGTAVPPGFAALQHYNQQPQGCIQQPQVPLQQISYGGNTYVQANLLGTGPMPLTTKADAENRPLQAVPAKNGGPKRSRNEMEESDYFDARPTKRQNRSKQN